MNWQNAIDTIPAEIKLFVQTIALAGGQTWAVGGWVRDLLAGRPAKDVDLEVTGVSVETLENLPGWFVNPAGHRMGVWLVKAQALANTETFEVCVPQRRERFGQGHMDERAVIDTSLSIEESLLRRDLTVNAMAVNLEDGTLVDPLNGQADLADGILREVDEINFVFDPVRMIRAMRFASTHNLWPTEQLLDMIYTHAHLIQHVDANRMRTEWSKWAASDCPENGINFLVASGLIEFFPTLQALANVEQSPIWHPEGDALTHTICALEEAPTCDPVVTWAILLHDVGKISCTFVDDDGNIVSPGHADVSADMVPAVLREFGFDIHDGNLPQWVQAVQALVREHMWLASFGRQEPSARSIRRHARRLSPATMHQWSQVALADTLGRGPASDMDSAAKAVRMAERAAEMDILHDAPVAIVMGRHLIDMHMQPGPHFGEILRAAEEAQMDGEFSDEAGGIAWVRQWLRENWEW